MILYSCKAPMNTLSTVPGVEIERYLGKWYEIARLPNSFEKGLVCVTADYSRRDDKYITVLNAGTREEDLSKRKTVTGKAWVPDASEPGRLKVQFFWPFSAGYYIFHLDKENYQYALVGHPSRKYLWVLSRSKTMDDQLYEELLDIAAKNGFATNLIYKVPQTCETY